MGLNPHNVERFAACAQAIPRNPPEKAQRPGIRHADLPNRCCGSPTMLHERGIGAPCNHMSPCYTEAPFVRQKRLRNAFASKRPYKRLGEATLSDCQPRRTCWEAEW